jgi:hypothetical protein
MAGIFSALSTWYHADRLLYAVVSMVTMLVVGTLLGLLMDWAGRKLGVDTSALKHQREKVNR